jgi:hypothetical protein
LSVKLSRRLAQSASKSDREASFLWEKAVDSTLNLLQQKRDSSMIEARRVCDRLAMMDEEMLSTRTGIALRAIERMYRKHTEILDSVIKNVQAQGRVV